MKRLYNSLSLKLGFSVGLVLFLTILGYAYYLLKTQEALAIQKILGHGRDVQRYPEKKHQVQHA